MNQYLLFFIALIPIVWLMISLGVLKMPGHKTTPITLLLTMILAAVVWKMPMLSVTTAFLEGSAMALWPIVLVIIAAVFTYNLSLHTGSMDVIKKMMTSITTDKRILILILAWGFGGFLEAIAGFGTAVAIPAGIMAALGFEPVFAAIICLIANTTPTAFGAIGLPVTSLAKLVNLGVEKLSFDVAILLFLFIVVVPFVLVILNEKSIKGIKGVFGITLASGLAFALPQIFVAKYMGAELPAVLGSVCSMAVTIIIAKVFYKEKTSKNGEMITLKQGFMAWLPFILVLVFIIGTSSLFPSIANVLSKVSTSVKIYHGAGAKAYTFSWIATPGTLIIMAAFIGGLLQGQKLGIIAKILVKTAKQMSKSAVTIVAIVALAKVMGYSGMIKSIAVVLVAVTGGFYPFISPIIGALGTFVTGSDTSANVLFGGLQVEAAKSLGVNQYWLAAANTCGATAGKMISPQSIAVATAATGLIGQEGKIFIKTLKFCLAYVAILGVMVYIGSLMM
ncbi:MAG: L-lactate permease [Bacillota bacterium]|nr:L-lactate permease [Bacillota bacterium]